MKKGLIILLIMFCMTIPAFNNIDTFAGQNSKLLVYDLTQFARPAGVSKLMVGQTQQAPNLCDQREQINLCCLTA